MDKVSLRSYDPREYKALQPGMFVRPLGSMGKNWHRNNTERTLPGYHPQVAIIRYPVPGAPTSTIQALEIQCSLPKVLFGNGLYELKDADFAGVCSALSAKLAAMGISMSPTHIARMSVRQVEYGKNILTKNIPVPYILQELYRSKPINHFMDVQRTTYRNDGEEVTFYCPGYEIAFYDKHKEILEALKKDPSILPAGIVNKLRKWEVNVLRMEVRFHNNETLKTFFKTHKLGLGTRLSDVFGSSKSQYILNYYWKKISKTAQGSSPFVMSPAFELWKLNQGRYASDKPQKKLAKLGVRCLLRRHGYKGAKWALERAGCSNGTQILRQYVSKTFRAHKRLNIWKFLDHMLQTFSCMDKKRWQTLKPQSRGAWFYETESLLTIAEVARWLHESVMVVQNLIQDGYLRAKEINNQWRMNRYDVLDYLYSEG